MSLGFIEKAIKVHGDTYDYSLVEYKDFKTKVKIICKVHGVFEQSHILSNKKKFQHKQSNLDMKSIPISGIKFEFCVRGTKSTTLDNTKSNHA